MKRGGRAEVCKGADPYLEDEGGDCCPSAASLEWACLSGHVHASYLKNLAFLQETDVTDYQAWLSLQQDLDTVKASPS